MNNSPETPWIARQEAEPEFNFTFTPINITYLNMNLTPRMIGYLQIIASGVCFGFLGWFGKTAYQFGFEPKELLALRFLTASALLFGLLHFTNSKPITRIEIFWALLLGVFGYAIFSSFYFLALKGVSVSLTVLLLYLYPTIVVMGDALFFKRRLNKSSLLALSFSLLGMYCLVAGEWSFSGPSYLMFGIGSALWYSVYILVSRKTLRQAPAISASMYLQFGAGAALSFVAFSGYDRPLELISQHGIFVLSMASICSVAPMTLFIAGLQKISPSEASLMSTTEPISGVLVGALLMGDRLSMFQGLGAILVILAMIIVARSPQVLD